MKLLSSILAALLMVSCATQSGRGTVSVVWDNEKSLADVGLAAVGIVASMGSTALGKAAEATTQKANAGHTTEVLGAQGVQKAEIEAGVAKKGLDVKQAITIPK